MTLIHSSALLGREVVIPAGGAQLHGTLSTPRGASGIVLFAHGSGSSRNSPRNGAVAAELQAAGLATLLMDLLEPAEEDDREKVFDIQLLAERLHHAAEWMHAQPETAAMRLGLFGASTGAAAALVAAAHRPKDVAAVVSRGGRPDLAGALLGAVQAPTLLIVGGADDVVLELNQQALSQLRCVKRLVVIPGATHLFPEPGALENVARLAVHWFGKHLHREESHVSES